MNKPVSKTIDNLQATIERLRRELEFARQETKRVIEEAKEREKTLEQVQADAEAKKHDVNQLRVQAEEVAKRKKQQERIILLQEEALLERQEREKLSQALEKNLEDFSVEREKILIEAQEEIIAVRSQAKEAWRRAEEEISRLDEDIDQLNLRLENEKSNRTSAENTIAKLEATLARIRQNSNAPVTEMLDKQHFDNLLKKAHLAIKSLQEQLTNTTAERDQFFTELSTMKTQAASLPTWRPSSQTNGSGRDPMLANISSTNKNKSALAAEKRTKTHELNLNQPLFDDDLNDELLLIEPDRSFERAESLANEETLVGEGLHADNPFNPATAASKQSPSRPTATTPPASPPETTEEEHPSEQSIADLARELLEESRSLSGAPAADSTRRHKEKGTKRPKLWQTKIDAANVSWRRIGWASILCIILLVLATAVYDRFFGDGLRRANDRLESPSVQLRIEFENPDPAD